MREPSAESFPVGLGEVIILLEVGPASPLIESGRAAADRCSSSAVQTGEAAKLFTYIQAQKLELSYAPHGGEHCEPKPWGFEQFSLLDPSGNKITSVDRRLDRAASRVAC